MFWDASGRCHTQDVREKLIGAQSREARERVYVNDQTWGQVGLNFDYVMIVLWISGQLSRCTSDCRGASTNDRRAHRRSSADCLHVFLAASLISAYLSPDRVLAESRIA